MRKDNEHQIVGSSDDVLAHIWWDGKKVHCTSPVLLRSFEKDYGMNVKGGPQAITDLVNRFRNGYFRIRKVRSN